MRPSTKRIRSNELQRSFSLVQVLVRNYHVLASQKNSIPTANLQEFETRSNSLFVDGDLLEHRSKSQRFAYRCSGISAHQRKLALGVPTVVFFLVEQSGFLLSNIISRQCQGCTSQRKWTIHITMLESGESHWHRNIILPDHKVEWFVGQIFILFSVLTVIFAHINNIKIHNNKKRRESMISFEAPTEKISTKEIITIHNA